MVTLKKPKLSASNYHSLQMNNMYWSASLCKSFLACEARTMAELRGEYERPKTDALLIGSYVDAAFESNGAFRTFKNQHALEIYKKNGEPRAEFVKADQMIERAKQDEVFMQYMRGRHQAIKTRTLFGVPFKAKFDVLRDSYKVKPEERRIVDLKTVRDFQSQYKPGQGRVNFAEVWEWPLQMALYQAIDGRHLPTYLACISKEDPPSIAVVEIPQERLDAEMAFLSEKMERWKGIRAGVIEPTRCEDCAYCRATKKLTVPVSLDWYDFGAEEVET